MVVLPLIKSNNDKKTVSVLSNRKRKREQVDRKRKKIKNKKRGT